MHWYSKNGQYPRENNSYDSISDADLLLQGIKRVPARPENNTKVQPPEYYVWDGNMLDWAFLVGSSINNDYFWEQIFAWRKLVLAEMDIVALRELEEHGSVSKNVRGYRQFLRDITDNHEVPYTFQYDTFEQWVEENA